MVSRDCFSFQCQQEIASRSLGPVNSELLDISRSSIVLDNRELERIVVPLSRAPIPYPKWVTSD
jgi:hypothetical protein